MGAPGVAGLVLEHLDMATGDGSPGAVDLLALRMGGALPATPLARLPGLEADMGVGCILRHPGEAAMDHPCTRDEDYGVWARLQWKGSAP